MAFFSHCRRSRFFCCVSLKRPRMIASLKMKQRPRIINNCGCTKPGCSRTHTHTQLHRYTASLTSWRHFALFTFTLSLNAMLGGQWSLFSCFVSQLPCGRHLLHSGWQRMRCDLEYEDSDNNKPIRVWIDQLSFRYVGSWIWHEGMGDPVDTVNNRGGQSPCLSQYANEFIEKNRISINHSREPVAGAAKNARIDILYSAIGTCYPYLLHLCKL